MLGAHMYLKLMKILTSQREWKFVFVSLLNINTSIKFSYNLSIENILIFVQVMFPSRHLNTFFLYFIQIITILVLFLPGSLLRNPISDFESTYFLPPLIKLYSKIILWKRTELWDLQNFSIKWRNKPKHLQLNYAKEYSWNQV